MADPPALGIDLGTTFSVVAQVNDAGQPVVLPNAEGLPTTPSVVLFDAGHAVVGAIARESLATEPESVVQLVKRHMGSAWTFDYRGVSYSPDHISATILRKLALDAQLLAGPVSRVDQVIGGASIVLIITLFLPWFGVSAGGFSASESGFDAHGYLFIPLLIAIVLIVYLVMRAGWDDPPRLPVAHAPLLLVGTGLQFLIVLIAFLVKPSFTNWEFGSYLALVAALVACAAIVVPAVQSMQGSRPGT